MKYEEYAKLSPELQNEYWFLEKKKPKNVIIEYNFLLIIFTSLITMLMFSNSILAREINDPETKIEKVEEYNILIKKISGIILTIIKITIILTILGLLTDLYQITKYYFFHYKKFKKRCKIWKESQIKQ
jgi:hypothetical protein